MATSSSPPPKVSNTCSMQIALSSGTHRSSQHLSFPSAGTTPVRRKRRMLPPITSPSEFPSHLGVKPGTTRLKPVSAKRGPYGSDFGDGHGLVDENMIVLRKRIHDIEMAEGKDEPPAHWMGWEKRYYAKYGSDVCEFVGLVQTMMMNTRPALTIGLVGLMAMSLPTSAALILLRVFEAAKMGALGG